MIKFRVEAIRIEKFFIVLELYEDNGSFDPNQLTHFRCSKSKDGPNIKLRFSHQDPLYPKIVDLKIDASFILSPS